MAKDVLNQKRDSKIDDIIDKVVSDKCISARPVWWSKYVEWDVVIVSMVTYLLYFLYKYPTSVAVPIIAHVICVIFTYYYWKFIKYCFGPMWKFMWEGKL